MATQETIKQLFSGGVLRDIEDVDARQDIAALQNALNALTSGDTTTAIENFQEVIDFLDGVTDDETLIGKITALQTAINGKQPMLTFDNVPTAGSNNPVKSGGVKTALDAKVNTETGKGLSSNDYTTAEKTKLAGLPTGGELTTALGNKANDADVVKGVIVDGSELPKNNGKVTIPAGADGITPFVGENGNWWVGPETDSNNDTGVKAQGPAGTSYTSADLEIGNALNGQGDVLGMAGAMQMKNNIDFVYGKLQALFAALGNIAFWEGKPANLLPQSLDWSVPQKTVTLDLTGSNFTVLHGTNPVVDSGTIQVDEGSDLVLTIVPESGYALDDVDSNTTGVIISQDLTTVRLPEVTADVTLDLTVQVVQVFGITYNLTDCAAPSGVTNPVSIADGGTATIVLETNVQGYVMPASLPSGAVTGATAAYTRDANNDQKATLVLTNATGAVSVTLAAGEQGLMMLRGYWIGVSDLDAANHTGRSKITNDPPVSGYSAANVVTTDYIQIPVDSSLQQMHVAYKKNLGGSHATHGAPVAVVLFVKSVENGVVKYAFKDDWGWLTNSDHRDNIGVPSSGKASAMLAALQAGNLYARCVLALTSENGDTINTGCNIKWGSTTLFDAASDAYTISDDPNDFVEFDW